MLSVIALARFCALAAASLPLIALFTLLAGRRGNAQICLTGAIWLLGLGQALATAGPVWLFCSYFREVLPYHASFSVMIAPLFETAGMPWSLSLLFWLAGWLGLFVAFQAITSFRANFRQDRYASSMLTRPIFFLLLSAGLCFAPFALINWPFSGLPENMEWDRAIMAVWRHATSEYFRGFCYAGAISLSLWPLWLRHFPATFIPNITRWLAFWAFACNLPWLLATAGPDLNMFFHSGPSVSYGMNRQIYFLAFFALAALCYAVLLWKPRFLAPCAWTGLGLLLAGTLAPFLLA